MRSAGQGYGRSDATERWCGPASKGAGDCRRSEPGCLLVWGSFTRLAGLRGPVGREEGLRGSPWCSSLALGRVEITRLGWRRLQRGRTSRRGSAVGRGKPRVARTDSEREERCEAGEACGTLWFRCSRRRVSGISDFGRGEWASSALVGIQAIASKARASVKSSVKTSGAVHRARGWITEAASGSERTPRSLRGEHSEGGHPANGCGMKQGHEDWVCKNR